jgi:phosphoadenosine phosphosulfate reductase
MTTAKTYTAEDLSRLSAGLEDSAPQDILRWAVDEFFPDLTLACSFGGPSGMVLVDMISQIERRVEVFYLDTDFLFPETHATRDRVIERYGVNAAGYRSLLTPEQQAAQHGDELWLRNPDLCCELRKVEPNKRALAGKRAWVSGLRRDQAARRPSSSGTRSFRSSKSTRSSTGRKATSGPTSCATMSRTTRSTIRATPA